MAILKCSERTQKAHHCTVQYRMMQCYNEEVSLDHILVLSQNRKKKKQTKRVLTSELKTKLDNILHNSTDCTIMINWQ